MGVGVQLRADAARNRLAIIEAARAVFSDSGLEAPLDDIAQRAGLGNATLYRHFPNRCTLIAAVYASTVEEVAEAGEQAETTPDPWDGFTDHVRFLCRLQAENRGLADLLTTAITGTPELEKLRRRAQATFTRLAARAKESGQLRDDFEPEDLALLLMANTGLVHRTGDRAPAASQRVIHYVLDGLRAGAQTTPSPPALGLQAVRAEMTRQATRLGCG